MPSALITQNTQVANVIVTGTMGAGVNATGSSLFYLPTSTATTLATCYTAYPNTGTVFTGFPTGTGGNISINGLCLPSASTTTGTILTAYVSGDTTYFTSSANVIQNYNGYAPVNWGPEDIDRMARAEKLRMQSRSAAVHRAKGSIKRALKLMDNVGFGDDIKVFLGGEEIEIMHPDSLFKFVLSKGHFNLIDRTIDPSHSTPYKLQLYTKTDVHVANLCVVAQNTPILDMVLATCMYIKSGSEEDLLEKANWSSLTSDPDVALELAVSSPMISKKLRLERFN